MYEPESLYIITKKVRGFNYYWNIERNRWDGWKNNIKPILGENVPKHFSAAVKMGYGTEDVVVKKID